MITTIDRGNIALIARDESAYFAEFSNNLPVSNAVYDFTFLGRFMIYHYHHNGEVIYMALDKIFRRSSRVLEVKKPLSVAEFEGIIPKILNSVKYTGFRVKKMYIC